MTIHKILWAAAALLLANPVSAQWNADSTDLDSYRRFRVGGYGVSVFSHIPTHMATVQLQYSF